MSSFYDPVAASLRAAIVAQWAAEGIGLDDAGRQVTLDTNTVLVVPRTAALLEPIIGPLRPDALTGAVVIDLGCGFGAMSLLLACMGASVVGVDPHSERLNVARGVAAEHGLAARFAQGRMEALPLTDERFDLAVINNALCYVLQPTARSATLTEALRVLRPGGRLVIRDPNRRNPRDQFTGMPLVHVLPAGLRERVLRRAGRVRSDVHLATPGHLRAELRTAGFVADAQLPVRSGLAARLARGVTGYMHVSALRPDPDAMPA